MSRERERPRLVGFGFRFALLFSLGRSLRLDRRFGLRAFASRLRRRGVVGHVHPFEDRQLSGVTLTFAQLHDAGIAPGAVLLGRGDFIEQNANGLLLAQPGDRQAAIQDRIAKLRNKIAWANERSDVLTSQISAVSAQIRSLEDELGVQILVRHGKRVVELAGGYGEISGFFAALGADVTCVEGRRHNITISRLRWREFKNITFIERDLEADFSDLGRFDLAIHFGLLYHIRNLEGNLSSTAAIADDIVLETEVVDSLDPRTVVLVPQDKRHHDRSLEGVGSRCSPFYIKEFFEQRGFDVEIITDPFLNIVQHHYSWQHKNDGRSRDGMRRFFRISKRPAS